MQNLFNRFAPKIGTILIFGAFIYFGIEGVISPDRFSNLVPAFIGNIINPVVLITFHGLTEVVCSILILSKIGGKWPWYIISLAFLGVLVSVSSLTLVRDIAIFGGLLLAYKERYL